MGVWKRFGSWGIWARVPWWLAACIAAVVIVWLVIFSVLWLLVWPVAQLARALRRQREAPRATE